MYETGGGGEYFLQVKCKPQKDQQSSKRGREDQGGGGGERGNCDEDYSASISGKSGSCVKVLRCKIPPDPPSFPPPLECVRAMCSL